MIRIRDEEPGDWTAVEALNDAAFGTLGEAEVVRRLRGTDGVISRVAVEDEAVVGHILFSPVAVGAARAVALGPMAVRPDRQRAGVGSSLVQDGLERCREAGYAACFVLGHPGYYPRFGFTPSPWRPRWDVPDEVFLVLALTEGGTDGFEGGVVYSDAFDDV